MGAQLSRPSYITVSSIHTYAILIERCACVSFPGLHTVWEGVPWGGAHMLNIACAVKLDYCTTPAIVIITSPHCLQTHLSSVGLMVWTYSLPPVRSGGGIAPPAPPPPTVLTPMECVCFLEVTFLVSHAGDVLWCPSPGKLKILHV